MMLLKGLLIRILPMRGLHQRMMAKRLQVLQKELVEELEAMQLLVMSQSLPIREHLLKDQKSKVLGLVQVEVSLV